MIRNREEDESDYESNEDDRYDNDNDNNDSSTISGIESRYREKSKWNKKIQNDRDRSKRRGKDRIKRKVKKASIEEAASSMSVSVDPYTFSLLRYASAKSDKKTCENSCPIGPKSFQNSPKLTGKRTKSFSNIKNKDNQSGVSTISVTNSMNENSSNNKSGIRDSMGPRSMVRVGYISYDCRSHPMGRLTKALLTTHNESKVR